MDEMPAWARDLVVTLLKALLSWLYSWFPEEEQ